MVIYISNKLHLYISKTKKQKNKNRTNRKQQLENYVQNVQTTTGMLRMKRKWEK